MALDGIALANVRYELEQNLQDGRIDKIYQPEPDEIIINVRCKGKNHKLLLTANASQPRIHLTELQKDNPQKAPVFCMVLRKHLSGGKIIKIEQPSFERIINIHIDSQNEMGDMTQKILIIEVMGKHSNIMLVGEEMRIINPIKNVSADKSSVRQVLPGKTYVLPPSQGKINPLMLDENQFYSSLKLFDDTAQKFIYMTYTGISPLSASEICFRAEIDSQKKAEELSENEIAALFKAFSSVVEDIKRNSFSPEAVVDKKEFSSIELTQYSDKKKYDSISALLEDYYKGRDVQTRMKQKNMDLRKFVANNIERCQKKKKIQAKTYDDTKDMDLWRLYGELITANIYAMQVGMKELVTQNYYSENMEDVKIPLDENLTAVENQQRYFNKYNKAKRTLAALEIQTKENLDEILYLEGILSALETSEEEADIMQIREELFSQGYIKKRGVSQKQKKAKPHHFKSSDGFDMYVGKNNIQNDELTLRFANGNDMWFHTKEIPGSHVIVRTNGQSLPVNTLNEAANLAAYFSKARASSSVPVDYTIKKNVKKPNGAKPGMVIYDHYNTAYVTPNEDILLLQKG